MDLGHVHIWQGEKDSYPYHVLEARPTFLSGGNFIWAKKTGEDWIPVFIGHSDFFADAYDTEIFEYAVAHQATALHIEANFVSPEERQAEVEDLMVRWSHTARSDLRR